MNCAATLGNCRCGNLLSQHTRVWLALLCAGKPASYRRFPVLEARVLHVPLKMALYMAIVQMQFSEDINI